MAGCLKIGVRCIYNNHVYTFGGKARVQDDEGPIGNRLTMCLADIRMTLWARDLLDLLKSLGVETHLAICYVDGLRFLLSYIELGTIWNKEKRRLEMSEV